MTKNARIYSVTMLDQGTKKRVKRLAAVIGVTLKEGIALQQGEVIDMALATLEKKYGIVRD